MGLGCPLGLEPCEQKPVSLDAKCYAINCENYFHCRSWVLPWPLPLHRMPAHPGSDFDPPIPHDYYLVDFLSAYVHGRNDEGFQDRNWADYFAEYRYAHACPLPIRRRDLANLTSKLKSLFKPVSVLTRFPIHFQNGMIGTMTHITTIMTIDRTD